MAIRGRSHLSLGTLVTGSTPLIWHMGKLRLGRLEGFAQSHTVSRWQSQDKNPGLWIFHLHQDIAPEGLLGLWGGTVPSPSPTPPGHAPSTQGARSLLRRVETQRPRAEPLLLLLPGPLPNSRGHRSLHGPLPSPFMAFLSALASASGLKSLAGRTVPFSCKKQKQTEQVPGGPPGGQAERGACEGGEAVPTSPKPSSLGGRGRREGTADRPLPES